MLKNEIANRKKFLRFQGQCITVIITFFTLAEDITYDFCSMRHILERKTWFQKIDIENKEKIEKGNKNISAFETLK